MLVIDCRTGKEVQGNESMHQMEGERRLRDLSFLSRSLHVNRPAKMNSRHNVLSKKVDPDSQEHIIRRNFKDPVVILD